VELPKLGKKNDIYLFKPKWPEMNIGKAHLKGGMPLKGSFDARSS
jgi:hypothetical protein